jgi:hypothetical protein
MSDQNELYDDERLRLVPTGALAVSGIGVGLLLVAWIAIYLLIYLPRGTVS